MPSERSLQLACWTLVACTWPAAAGEAPLTLQGNAAYHRLRVPLSVQVQTLRSDLADIQILNGRGEPLPHAWVPTSASEPASQSRVQPLPYFAAPAPATAVSPRSAPASLGKSDWIVDARAASGSLVELRLQVPATTNGVFAFALETSPDLQRWSTVRSHAQLVALQRADLRLVQATFPLDGADAHYLRLRTLPGHDPVPLTGVQVTSVVRPAPVAALQWTEPITPARCTPAHCDYELPRHVPADRIEWELVEPNTLASVQLFVQLDPSEETTATPPPWRHHRLRDRLREHVHGHPRKTPPAASAPAPAPAWRPMLTSQLYWLRLPQGDVRSPATALGGRLVTQLRIEPRGGMAQLGSTPPALRIGSRAASLVFLARGHGPFKLAWGRPVDSSAIPLAQLMPSREPGDGLPAETAVVVATTRDTAPVAPPALAPRASASLQMPPRDLPPAGSDRFWVWAALLTALGLMGYLAWTLLRPASAQRSDPAA